MRCLLPLALCLSFPVAAQIPKTDVRLVFEAIGPQAPMREAFDVTAGQVAWRDDQSQVRMLYDRHSRVLQLGTSPTSDPSTGVLLNEDGIAELARQMRMVTADMERQAAQGTPAQQALTRQRWQQLIAPRGPWSAIDQVRAEDTRAMLGDGIRVLGFACSRIALQARGEPVGEACVAPPQSVAGGAAVLEMLQAMASALDRLRMLTDGAVLIAWPSHPLVPAARSGQLPLQVVQQTPGGVRQTLQLSAIEPLTSPP
jgi:hypothetical protein